MKLKFKIFTLLVLFFFIACGKKTVPITKSQFISPDESKISITTADDGISIINNSNIYNLIVLKSLCETCTDDFHRVAVINADSNFIDRDVQEDKAYFYKFTFKHPEYSIFSEDIIKRITYNKPVAVSSLNIEITENSGLLIEPAFSDKIHHYDLYLNNRLISKTRDKKVLVNLEEETNTIKLIPYDIYNNEGKYYTKTIAKSELLKPEDIKEVNFVFGRKNLFISWEISKNAQNYDVTISYDNNTKSLKTAVNYLRIEVPDNINCYELDIVGVNEFQKSPKKHLRACRK